MVELGVCSLGPCAMRNGLSFNIQTFVRDTAGNITAILDYDGRTLARFRYDAWGNIVREWKSNDPNDGYIRKRAIEAANRVLLPWLQILRSKNVPIPDKRRRIFLRSD